MVVTFSYCKTPKTLSISKTTMYVSEIGESFSINISSNTDWTINSSNNWCKAESSQGSDDATIVIEIEKNYTYNERTAIITVYGTDANSVTVSVIQKAGKYILIKSPSSSINWETGQEYTIQWDDNISENVKIELFNSSSYVKTIVESTLSNGSYNWFIPNDFTPEINYRIKIKSISDSVITNYSDYFSVYGTVTDYDGNTYQTLTIGDQEWMVENLKVTCYPNGDSIPNVTADANWGSLGDNDTDDAYCYYDNNEASGYIYGALYTYAAAIGDNWERDNTANQGVCPDGWHLPTDVEWTKLTDYLGGLSTAGGKMKETGTTYWNSPNTGADNSSGFSVLPGSYRHNSNGNFNFMGRNAHFWSATEYYHATSMLRRLGYDYSSVYRGENSKSYGFSVRCLRD